MEDEQDMRALVTELIGLEIEAGLLAWRLESSLDDVSLTSRLQRAFTRNSARPRRDEAAQLRAHATRRTLRVPAAHTVSHRRDADAD